MNKLLSNTINVLKKKQYVCTCIIHMYMRGENGNNFQNHKASDSFSIYTFNDIL